MRLQQAVFTSSERSTIKGYQLVAQSSLIDRKIAKELHRWSPSHFAAEDPARWSLNYFPVSEDRVAVSRTVLGGPEYSSRGALQVVTLIIVLDNEQFKAYHNNALAMAQTAMALGGLRLPSEMPRRSLEPLELPDAPFVRQLDRRLPVPVEQAQAVIDSLDTTSVSQSHDSRVDALLHQMMGFLQANKRIALVGAEQSLDLLSRLILGLDPEQRRALSFTSGLPPASPRPFRVHFLPRTNLMLNQSMKAEGIEILHAKL